MTALNLTTNATIWFKAKNLDLDAIAWVELNKHLANQFYPVDYNCRASDQLAKYS